VLKAQVANQGWRFSSSRRDTGRSGRASNRGLITLSARPIEQETVLQVIVDDVLELGLLCVLPTAECYEFSTSLPAVIHVFDA
jgi:hypothetical protein